MTRAEYIMEKVALTPNFIGNIVSKRKAAASALAIAEGGAHSGIAKAMDAVTDAKAGRIAAEYEKQIAAAGADRSKIELAKNLITGKKGNGVEAAKAYYAKYPNAHQPENLEGLATIGRRNIKTIAPESKPYAILRESSGKYDALAKKRGLVDYAFENGKITGSRARGIHAKLESEQADVVGKVKQIADAAGISSIRNPNLESRARIAEGALSSKRIENPTGVIKNAPRTKVAPQAPEQNFINTEKNTASVEQAKKKFLGLF